MPICSNKNIINEKMNDIKYMFLSIRPTRNKNKICIKLCSSPIYVCIQLRHKTFDANYYVLNNCNMKV